MHPDRILIDSTQQLKCKYGNSKLYIDWLKEKDKRHPKWIQAYKTKALS